MIASSQNEEIECEVNVAGKSIVVQLDIKQDLILRFLLEPPSKKEKEAINNEKEAIVPKLQIF